MRPGQGPPRRSLPELRLYFSDHFGVKRAALERFGALDISLVADLPLFIDPFLLFHSRRPVYRALHRQIIDYLVFLRNKAADPSLSPALIDSVSVAAASTKFTWPCTMTFAPEFTVRWETPPSEF